MCAMYMYYHFLDTLVSFDSAFSSKEKVFPFTKHISKFLFGISERDQACFGNQLF